MPEEKDVLANRVDDGANVLELALERIVRSITASATSAPVSGFNSFSRIGRIGQRREKLRTPCTSTSGGPVPRRSKAIGVPSFDSTVAMIRFPATGFSRRTA